jgi:ABC-type sugar transport system substrate-binding protein
LKFAAFALVVAMAFSACGSSKPGSTNASLTSSYTLASASGGGRTPLPAEKIGVIGTTGSAPVVISWESIVAATTKALGWSTIVENGQNTPSVWDTEMQNLVTQRVSAIVTFGIDATTAEPELEAAKKAGIPVLATGLEVNPVGDNLFAGLYQDNALELGTAMAKYILQKTPKPSVVVQNLSIAYAVNGATRTFERVLTAGGGKVLETEDDSGADPTQSYGASAVSLMRAHPSAQYLVSLADFPPAIDIPALQQANLLNHVTIAAAYDDPITSQEIKAGQPVISAAVNWDQPVVDALGALAAFFAKGTPIPFTSSSYKPKVIVIDKANLAPGGTEFPPAGILAKAVSKWRLEYKLP